VEQLLVGHTTKTVDNTAVLAVKLTNRKLHANACCCCYCIVAKI